MKLELTTLILTILPYMVGFGAFAIFMQYMAIKLERKLKKKYGESTNARIDRLASSLKEAISLSSEIESEIQNRHKIVQKLEEDVDRYNKLASLKSSEVEAIVQTIGGELQKESNNSLWKGALINFIFFIAGVLVTFYAG